MTLVYSIRVLAVIPQGQDILSDIYSILNDKIHEEETSQYKSVKLSIYREYGNYRVVYTDSSVEMGCGSFSTEKEAFAMLNTCMKRAMKGKLVYFRCICGEKVFFPLKTCQHCFTHCLHKDWTTDENENLGFFSGYSEPTKKKNESSRTRTENEPPKKPRYTWVDY